MEELKAQFTEILSGDNARIRAATFAILDFNKNVEVAVPTFVEILGNDPDKKNRQFSAIFLNSIFRKSYEGFPAEFSAQIRENLCQIISNEAEANVRNSLCTVVSFIFLEDGYGPVPELISELLQKPGFVATGLVLLRETFSMQNGQGLEELIPAVLPRIVEICSSENVEERTQSISLLSELLDDETYGDPIDEMQCVPSIISGLIQNASKSDVNEATALFKLVESALKNDLDSFADHQTEFMQIAIGIMTDEEVDPNVRILAADAISEVMKVNIDEVEDELQTIIETFLEVSAQMYEMDPTSIDYQFPSKLFDALGETEELSIDAENDLFDFILDKVSHFIGDEDTDVPHINVGLATIINLLTVVPDLTLNYEDDIMGFVQQGLDSEDENIIGIAAEIVEKLCESIPENCTHHIGTLTPLLMPKIEMFRVQNALAALFDNSTIPPPNIEEVLTTLVQAISEAPDDSKGDFLAITCLALSKATVVAAQFYNDLKQVIFSSLEEGDASLKANAIRLFGIFAKNSPNAVEEDVPQLLGVINELFSVGDYTINGECCACLSNISATFPVLLDPFVEELVTSITGVLDLEEVQQLPGEEEDEQEYLEIQKAFNEAAGDSDGGNEKFNDFIKMKCAAIDALSMFCSSAPQKMAEQFDAVSQRLISMVSPDDLITLQSVCNGIVSLCIGFKAVEKDPSELLAAVIGILTSEETPLHEGAAILWETVGRIIEVYGKSIVDAHAEEICGPLLAIFNPETNKYIHRGDIPVILQPPIFFTLDTIVKCEGEESRPIIEPVLEFLVANAESTKKSHVRSAHSLMVFACSCGDRELAAKALEIISSRDINSPNVETKMIALSGTTECVKHFPDLLAENAAQLAEICFQIFTKMQEDGESITLVETAVSLYISLIMFAGVQPNQEQLTAMISRVLDNAKSSEFNYIAEYIASGHAAIAQDLALRASVIILSSDEGTLSNIPSECVSALAQIASSAGEEYFVEVLRNDQKKIQQLITLLQSFQK